MHALFIFLLAIWPFLEKESIDSLRTTDIEEVVIVSTPKESQPLRRQPLASTSFSQSDMRQMAIRDVTDLTAHVPGLFIPNYGSRLTTSVYVRGIGSRIGTPAVALYVDGVPQFSLASYDFNFSDVDRIDVLRGPQGTLYGRNSMGGVIRVYTKNPFHYQGTDLTISASAAPEGILTESRNGGSGRVRASLTHYHRVSSRFAFSSNLFGDVDGGFFRNQGRGGELMDHHSNLGGRLRMIGKLTESFQADLSVHYEWLRQGGYPYEYLGEAGTPSTPDPTTALGQVAYNRECGYRRHLLNTGLTLEKQWPAVVLTSVTGFQHLSDRMDLDQDFTTTDLYSLRQQQRSNTLSQEIIVRPASTSKSPSYSWLLGMAASHQWLRTTAPVTFFADGLSWLNGLINRQANTHLPTVESHDETGAVAYTMNFLFDNMIQGSQLAFPGTYVTPTTNVALFHQSTLHGLFRAPGLVLTAGLRLDYERFGLTHQANYAFQQDYGLGGRLTYPDGRVRDGMTLVPQRHFEVTDALDGNVHTSYWQLLPRLTLQYAFPASSSQSSLQSTHSVYLSLSRGYRSGGYNIQMFSELLQSRMQTAIMHNVAEATVPVVESVTAIPNDVRGRVVQMLTDMGTPQTTDVQASTWYRPESSWNVEVGGHFNLFGGDLRADFSAFWMETRDQQVSQMSAGGLGRVTVNNGRSRSLGIEASLKGRLSAGLQAEMAYAYTYARFLSSTSTLDPTFVPFIPRNTLYLGLTRSWSALSLHWADALVLHAGYRAAGPIFWNSENSAKQAFAGSILARVSLKKAQSEWSLYASNVLGTRYQTFYFETMQRAFAQYARPLEVGLEFRLRF